MSSSIVSNRSRAFWLIYGPIMWGLGVALLALIGFTQLDILTAFFVGFIVGFLHDLALIKVYEYRNNLELYTHWDLEFHRALKYYEEGDWTSSLKELNSILKMAPDHKRALYYAALCNKELGNWVVFEELCIRYLEFYPEDLDVRDMLEMVQH